MKIDKYIAQLKELTDLCDPLTIHLIFLKFDFFFNDLYWLAIMPPHDKTLNICCVI